MCKIRGTLALSPGQMPTWEINSVIAYKLSAGYSCTVHIPFYNPAWLFQLTSKKAPLFTLCRGAMVENIIKFSVLGKTFQTDSISRLKMVGYCAPLDEERFALNSQK